MKVIEGKIQVKPCEVEYDESRLEVLNQHFKRLMDEGLIQSTNYCLSRNGKIFANNAIGKQSYEESDTRDLQIDAIHRVASITKIICATAIFKLFEDGFLRPLQPVCDILPEFGEAPFNAINISHLLTHTSGLYPDGGCFPYKYLEYWELIPSTAKGESWVKNITKAGMYNKPGKEWAYCSFGYVLLGEIIQRVTGISAEAYIHKTILEPCGMKDSFFNNDIVRGELPTEFVKTLKDRLYIQSEEEKKDLENLKEYKEGQLNCPEEDRIWTTIPATAGGIYSTAEDLNKFGRMLLNGGVSEDGKRVIGRKAIERMTLNYTTEDVKDNCWGAGGNYRMYALGPDTRWNADSHFTKGSFFHEGAGACCLLMDPTEKMVASWFVPWAKEGWFPQALFNASAVMWSGII